MFCRLTSPRVPAATTRRGLHHLALLVGLLAACSDDDDAPGSDPTDAGLFDADRTPDAVDPSDAPRQDALSPHDTADQDDTLPAPDDVRPPPEIREPDADVLTEPPVPDPSPDRPADWYCNEAARIDACDSPWIAPTDAPTDPADLLFHVNRVHALPADWPIPTATPWDVCSGATGVLDLVCLPTWATDGRPQSLRAAAWSAPAPDGLERTHDGLPVGYEGRVGFESMLRAVREEAGLELFVLSSFRPFDRQRAIHESYVLREVRDRSMTEQEARIFASTYSAVPGHSEHQLGTTADLTFRTDSGSLFSGLDAAMGASRAFRWMFRNAHRFGIVVTYGAHRVETTQYVYEPWHVRFVGVEAADAMRRCALNTEELLTARYERAPQPPFAGFPYILFPEHSVVAWGGALPGSVVAPGAEVEVRWNLRNSGTTNWWNPIARVVNPVDGDVLDPTPNVALPTCTLVGQDIDVALTWTAPSEPGLYAHALQLQDGAGRDIQPPLDLWFRVGEEADDEGLRFVRVRDRSGRTSGQTPGADIDAVLLLRDSDVFPAVRVIDYSPAPTVPTTNQPEEALGLPDAYPAWPDLTACRVDGGFVSLGGEGTITVELPSPLRSGDTLEVLEVGGCLYDGANQAIADAIEVEVGPSDDGPWFRIGGGVGGAVRGRFE